MDIHFKKLLLPILALFAMTAHAQSLSGLVTDEETGQPLEAVMISVLRNGTMIDYALTDARGGGDIPCHGNTTAACKSAYHCWAIDGKYATYRQQKHSIFVCIPKPLH